MRPVFVAVLLLAFLPLAAASAASSEETATAPAAAEDSAWWHIWNMFGVTWFDPGDVPISTPVGIGFDIGLEIGVGGTEPNTRFLSGLAGFSVQTVSFDDPAYSSIGATGMHLAVLVGNAMGNGFDIFGIGRTRWLAGDFSVEGEPLLGVDGHLSLDVGLGARWLPLEDGDRNWFIGFSFIAFYGILDNAFTIGFDISIPMLFAAYAN